MPKRKRYYLTRCGHAAGVDFLIRSPDRRIIANIFAVEVWAGDGILDQAEADAQLIVDALNAYTQGGRP